MSEWRPIETAPEGEMILLSFPDANRGAWGCEVAMLYRDADDISGRGFCLWTNGGPNGGDDLYFDGLSAPTHWMPLPEPPV